MIGTVFVDTNVLVYARDRSEADKQRRAIEWIAALQDTRLGRLSAQVLMEYYVVTTKKLDPPREVEDAREDVLTFQTWKPTPMRLDVIERAWDVQDRFKISWWDALIAGAALVGGCEYLLSEDFQDGLEIDGLTVVNPFLHAPETLLPESA
jgi:predicted nucleic acid-binding protein